VRTIAGGFYHSLALKNDDTLWAWGKNEFGELGDGTTTNRSTPVRVLSEVQAIAGGQVYSLGGLGSSAGQFSNPQGMAVDAQGDFYVADRNNNRIQKFNSNGVFITKWGSPGSGDGQFISPLGVAIDFSGNVYVADSGNNRIQKFGDTTTTTTSEAGTLDGGDRR
jgi:sugar lactone lactonase YvrE